MWAKFSARHPCASFDEFWDYKLQKYEARNEEAKQFFRAFSRYRIGHHRVLLPHRKDRELRHLGRIGEGAEYSAPQWLTTLKVEPVKEGEIGPLSYTCKGPSPF